MIDIKQPSRQSLRPANSPRRDWLDTVLGWAGAPDIATGPQLDAGEVETHNQRNRQQTLKLVAGMALLLLCAAVLLAGWWGLLLVLVNLVAMVVFGPRAAPESVMRAYGGELVAGGSGGNTLLAVIDELTVRAELPRPPKLYVIPSAALNAFAVGTRTNSAIALTEGLIRRLPMRELAGVLAHEMAHIRNGDLFIMGLADGITRMARVLSLAAVVLFVMNLLAVMTGGSGMSWLGLLLLYLTPLASGLLQQALSRTREFDADLDGVTLTGDAQGLASALTKLEQQLGQPWEDLVYGNRRVPQPCVLRSHPTTAERVARLARLTVERAWPQIVVAERPYITGRAGVGTSAMTPRYHWKRGVWY